MASREELLLKWASGNVKVPWLNMVKVASKVAKGEPLSESEKVLTIPLTPFEADYRVLYTAMDTFGGLLTWSPNNLFTIITDKDQSKILRAYIEVTRDHNFIDLIEINLDEPFLKDALTIIRSKNLYPLRRQLDDVCKKRFGKRINWVKIANIEFFSPFKEALESFNKTGDLVDYFSGALNAVMTIYEKDLIAFTPEPPAFARLRDLFTKILDIDTAHLNLAQNIGPIPANKPQAKRIVMLLKGHQTLTGFSLGGSRPTLLTLDHELTQELLPLPITKVGKVCAQLSGADLVLTLRSEPIANLVYEALFHEMPYDREDTKIVLRKTLEIVRRYRELWSIYPTPFYLADHFRLPLKWLGNPCDINYLASWFLPGVIIDGEALFLGQHSHRTFVTLDGEKIKTIYSMEFYDGGIRKVTTRDPSEYEDIFTGMEHTYNGVKEQAINLGIRLWNEGHGFQNQVVVIQSGFMEALSEVGSLSIWKSPFRLLRLIKPIRKMIRIAKEGGIVTYPDAMLVSLEKWVRKVGRLNIYLPVLTVPFDRKRPRSRGLKYIGATVAAVAVIGLIIGLVSVL